jgi:hypothetical protein
VGTPPGPIPKTGRAPPGAASMGDVAGRSSGVRRPTDRRRTWRRRNRRRPDLNRSGGRPGARAAVSMSQTAAGRLPFTARRVYASVNTRQPNGAQVIRLQADTDTVPSSRTLVGPVTGIRPPETADEAPVSRLRRQERLILVSSSAIGAPASAWTFGERDLGAQLGQRDAGK